MLSNVLWSIWWLIRDKAQVLLAFFVGGILVGFALGRHYSPQPDKVKVAAAYLLLYGYWSRDAQQNDSIVLSAYPYGYTWTSSARGIVQKKLFSPSQLAAAPVSEHKDWDADLKDLLTVAVAAPVGSLAATLITGGSPTERMGKTELIGASVVTLGGVLVGYELGHRTQPDTSDEKFIKNIEDPELWAGANEDFRRLFVWYMRSCISGIIDQKDKNTFPTVFGKVPGVRKGLHQEIQEAACAEVIRQEQAKQAQRLQKSAGKPPDTPLPLNVR